jgi:hypothetical protein
MSLADDKEGRWLLADRAPLNGPGEACSAAMRALNLREREYLRQRCGNVALKTILSGGSRYEKREIAIAATS